VSSGPLPLTRVVVTAQDPYVRKALSEIIAANPTCYVAGNRTLDVTVIGQPPR
jgi:hypothetical protein